MDLNTGIDSKEMRIKTISKEVKRTQRKLKNRKGRHTEWRQNTL
jgi:hypothetical protein